MSKSCLTIDQINSLDLKEFVNYVGPVFEHSFWIAEWGYQKKPFQDVNQLHQTLCNVVLKSNTEKQIQLIQAHPDLVGKAALQGTLTPESTKEQASAGLGDLAPEEVQIFQKLNKEYKDKFGFPFVICARLHKKEAILSDFKTRVNNSKEQEIKTALEEIFKIARLRLGDLII